MKIQKRDKSGLYVKIPVTKKYNRNIKKGWQDVSEMIPTVLFEMLLSFINEWPDRIEHFKSYEKQLEWKSDHDRLEYENAQEIIKLYNYYTNRDKFSARIDDLVRNDKTAVSLWAYKRDMYDMIEQQMLHRLIDIHKTFWS